jgi:hypothetical protein
VTVAGGRVEGLGVRGYILAVQLLLLRPFESSYPTITTYKLTEENVCSIL